MDIVLLVMVLYLIPIGASTKIFEYRQQTVKKPKVQSEFVCRNSELEEIKERQFIRRLVIVWIGIFLIATVLLVYLLVNKLLLSNV